MQAFIGVTLLANLTLSSRQHHSLTDRFTRHEGVRGRADRRLQSLDEFPSGANLTPASSCSADPEEARARCQKVLGNVAHGHHPLQGLGGTDGITLGMFIADTYTWVNASRPRTATNTLEKLHWHFRTWYPEPLTAITVERIESGKARRLNEGRSASTVLRDLFTLSSVLRRAVKAGELIENPVRRDYDPFIAEDEAMSRDIDELNAQMIAAGARVFAGGLRPASSARSLRAQPDGAVLVTEGPYFKTKEHVGGVGVLEAPDPEAALEWGRKAALACRAPVEVRPFYSL
jgi:hypothetical protein